MLIVLLAGFEAIRKRGPWWVAIACGVAFAIPTLTPSNRWIQTEVIGGSS